MAFVSSDERLTEFHWIDREGRLGPRIATLEGRFRVGAIAPDDRRAIVVHTAGVETNLWLLDLVSGETRQLTSVEELSRRPQWFPDSRRIVYQWLGRAGEEVRTADVDDPASIHALHPFPKPGLGEPTSISSDGKRILFARNSNESFEILAASHDSTWHTEVYAQDAEHAWCGKFFDSGRRVAFVRDVAGTLQMFADSYPIRNGPSRLTTEACGISVAYDQLWATENELLYVAPDGRTVRSTRLAVSGGNVMTGRPQTLFTLPAGCRGLCASADGRRFLISMPVGPTRARTVTLVQNWSRELERRP